MTLDKIKKLCILQGLREQSWDDKNIPYVNMQLFGKCMQNHIKQPNWCLNTKTHHKVTTNDYFSYIDNNINPTARQ